jgi:hypothetical protein
MYQSSWHCALTLDAQRNITDGGPEDLAAAVRRGADLRVQTAFRHNEHIDTDSSSAELVEEVAEFKATYLLNDRFAAGIMTNRQPVQLPDGFGPRPSMSFFLYNQDGHQAIARPFLDGRASPGEPGPAPPEDHSAMPKYHHLDGFDAGTNAPSGNFIYDFEQYRFLVRDDWTEVLSHGAEGQVVSGAVDDLAAAFVDGCDVKVAIRGLCADLDADRDPVTAHEVFVPVGYSYYYTEQKLYIGATHPTVRVKTSIPMRYESRSWDFGWLLPRTDGYCARLLNDPYSLQFHRSTARYAMRWFVR